MPSKLLLVLLPACLLPLASPGAAEYRITAASPPGSGWDQLAQTLRDEAGRHAGGDVLEVVNVPGLGGTVGLARFLAETTPGALVTGLTMLDASLVQRVPVPLDRLAPIARLAVEPFALVVPASSPFATPDDLRAAMWSEAGKVTWAGGPAGSVDHVAAALFARAIGIDPARLNYVPFLATADAAAALGDGKVAAAILSASDVAGEARAGRLRVLGTTAPAGDSDPSGPPSLAAAGIPLDLQNWRGLVGRPDMAAAERRTLEALARDLVATPGWQALLDRKGWRAGYLDADAFGGFLRADQARVKDALKATGTLKPPN